MRSSLSQKVSLIALVAGLLVSAFFMANVELPRWASSISTISLILFALPSLWALRRWLGMRDGAVLYLILALFAIVIESIAISTGIPYGRFSYSDHLGYKLFGGVPWTVSFGWPPLALGCYAAVASRFTNRAAVSLTGATMLVACDLVLDPGAVYLGFWNYSRGGEFYGVPVSNFAGWFLTGAIGIALLDLMVRRKSPLLPVPIQLTTSAVLTIFFWSGLAMFAGLLTPALIGLVVMASFALAWRKFYYAFDDKIVLVDENKKAIATASKLDAHNESTRLHLAFSIFVFNSKGEVLLQRRALSKKTWPGVWSNSCCGHVMLHESVEAAAARRLRTELGFNGLDLEIMLPDFRYRAEKDGIVENEICPVLVGSTDRQPDPEPAEVESIRWMDWNAFRAWAATPESGVSPWAVDEARLLTESATFREWFAANVKPSST